MSARITIQSGIAEGTSHVLKGRVARVGSDPQSEVCLPTNDIPGHALTLEFREDGCRVYNRCRQSVYIGSQTVEPDQVVEWPETDMLQLGANTKLLLDFDVDLSDAESTNEGFEEYDSESDYPADDDLSADSASASKSATAKLAHDKPAESLAKTALQLGVTVACLAGCVLLLVRDQGRESGPKSGPGFAQIISTALETAEVSPELVKRLQYAEAQRVRGRNDVAENEYQSIRDDLVLELGRSEQASETPNSQILHFVQTRLSSDP